MLMSAPSEPQLLSQQRESPGCGGERILPLSFSRITPSATGAGEEKGITRSLYGSRSSMRMLGRCTHELCLFKSASVNHKARLTFQTQGHLTTHLPWLHTCHPKQTQVIHQPVSNKDGKLMHLLCGPGYEDSVWFGPALGILCLLCSSSGRSLCPQISGAEPWGAVVLLM